MRFLLLGFGLGLSLAGFSQPASHAQSAGRAGNDTELQTHLKSLQARIDDPTVDLVVRERLALDMASTLDRAAQSANQPESRRNLWGDAVLNLDRFRKAHPNQGLGRAFEVQAAVYLWARARMEMTRLEVEPGDQAARTRAIEDLEDAINRLKAVAPLNDDVQDIVVKNSRFRLAQALADLAEIGPEDGGVRDNRNRAALDALSPPIVEPSLVGFALLLKASLLSKLNRAIEAQGVLDEASKLQPPVPPLDLQQARIEILIARRQYGDALKLVDGANGVDAGLKPFLRARIRLVEWKNSSPDGDRSPVEAALFQELKTLRKTKRQELRAILLEVAKTIKQPGPKQNADTWDLLADGALAVGDKSRAGELERKGADRAKELGNKAESVDYRLKSGAYFFQAGQYAEADKILGQILNDPDAGASRIKASLLIALARGRAISENSPGASASLYKTALKSHLKLFPDDPSSQEARWLLGKIELAEGNRAGATALWSALSHGQSRWLDAQIELARLKKVDLDNQRLNGDREATETRFKEALDFLDGRLKEGRGDGETNPIRIEMARIDLTPTVGRPADALKLLDAVLHSAISPEQQTSARWLRLVALGQLSRFVEAEQFVRSEARNAYLLDLLEPLRILDRTAAESESDLRARRVGYLMNLILDRLKTFTNVCTPEQLAEISLRSARSLAFSGDEAGAKRALASGKPLPKTSHPDLLRDLAETYARLEVYGLAEDVQRLRAKQLVAGSLPWLEARYGLALAYYHEGKTKEALHLIDATSILHPELGGGSLKTRFIRLRQKVAPDPSEGSN